MKTFYIWIAFGIAGIIVSIMLFANHNNLFVLLLSLAMCSLTIAGVVRTTTTSEDQSTYLYPVITSFLGCIIVGGYFNALAYGLGFFNTTFYTGILSIPILLLDKESKATMGSFFGDGFRQLFNFVPDAEGCFINVIVGMLVIVLSVCIGVLFMLISYINATAKLLRADVSVNENVSGFWKKLNVDLFPKNDNPSETESSENNDNGDWL